MTRRVFISYRSLDGLAADALISVIQEMPDYHVWYDQKLHGGQQWWDEIIQQIQRADVVILALSNAYLDSEACHLERQYAYDLNKPVIPVQIDHALNFDRLDSWIQNTQIVRYHAYDRNKEHLQNALENTPSRPLPATLPEVPPAPSSDATEAAESQSTPQPLSKQAEAPGPVMTDNNNRIAILVALIGGATTIIAALIGILPGLLSGTSGDNTTQTGITGEDTTLTTTSAPTVEPVSGDFDITLIYGDEDSFIVQANAESHLWALSLSSDIATEIPARSFPVLQSTGYVVEDGTCLQYVRTGATPPRSRGCAADTTFTQELLPADVFWYDTGSNRLQDLVLRQNGDLVALCSSASRHCDISVP